MPDEKKQRNWLLAAIRCFSLLCLPLLCLPFTAVYLNCLLLLPGVKVIWQYQLLCMAVCLVGLGVSALFQKIPFSQKRRWICDFLSILLVFLPILAGLATGKWWLGLPDYMEIPAGLFLIFPWILGIRAQGKEYHEVIDRFLFVAYLVESIFAVVIYAFNGVEFPLVSFTGGLLAIAAAYGLSRNQGNLDFLMERRGHSFSHLPARIRYYNIRLLIIILAGTILVFFLCFPMSALVKQFFSLLRYWISMISFGTSEEEEEIFLPSDDVSRPEPTESSPGASLFWNILSILIIIGVLILLIRNGKKILQAILNAFQRLLSSLRQIMTRQQFAGPKKVESEYYVDEDSILEDSLQTEQLLTEKQRLRRWKQQCRRFRKMPEGPEKLRFGYGLVISGMKLKNFPLTPGNTPLEILVKTAPILQNSCLTHTTPSYNQVRYDTSSPSQTTLSLEELQAVLEELEKRAPLPKVSHRLS